MSTRPFEVQDLSLHADQIRAGDLLWDVLVVQLVDIGKRSTLLTCTTADRKQAEVALDRRAMVAVKRTPGGWRVEEGVVTQTGHYDRYITESEAAKGE